MCGAEMCSQIYDPRCIGLCLVFVTTRLLDCLHDPLGHFSRLQRIIRSISLYYLDNFKSKNKR